MPELSDHLDLERCPHCNVDSPNISVLQKLKTKAQNSVNERLWYIYSCKRCGGVITAWATHLNERIFEIFPYGTDINDNIPARAKEYLEQAHSSLNAPAGAVMLAASSVDAMLKILEYTEGSLYSRIEKAAKDHLITSNMAKWAHEVRLDANEQRHADVETNLPTIDDAKRVIDFSLALAEILFVLPSRVEQGLNATEENA